MKKINEPAREVPVIKEVDVLVVGGGPAGIMAAQAAAVAVRDGVQPRDVNVAEVQKLLREEGVYFRE